MTSTAEPVRWDRTIYRGTDHDWQVRRLDAAGLPIIPEAARAQVRAAFGGQLWVECLIAIDAAEGWVTITIPESATEAPEWDNRSSGVWDLEAVVGGKTYRWAQGLAVVSQDVTRELVTF